MGQIMSSCDMRVGRAYCLGTVTLCRRIQGQGLSAKVKTAVLILKRNNIPAD